MCKQWPINKLSFGVHGKQTMIAKIVAERNQRAERNAFQLPSRLWTFSTLVVYRLPWPQFKYALFYKNVVFPAQAEYSYFSTDFRLKIFLYYS